MHHVLEDHLGPWRFVEYTCLAALVIRQSVTSLCVEVLHVGCVTTGADIHRRSLADRGKSGSRRDLLIGVVSKFRSSVVHLASDLLKGVSARARVLP